ncbi:UNVERIFIED_CONTAM: hypothetical protein Sangu_3214000 [Sesamum angustifolium]|uniref:DUF4283 domain-containing protein n=1 Tax=Sesamum angustifolium TaxID=2727405 RepID=A0AAW2JK95_9LAMI
MANLNSLKERWEQKFKTSKNPALKSVTGRPSTPFRPRISLLPRRCVRTSTDPVPLTDLAYPVIRPGIDSHGSSSSSHVGLSSPQGQEPQESLLPLIPMFRLNCLRICHKIVGQRDPVVILKKMSPKKPRFHDTSQSQRGSNGVGATGLSCSGLDSTDVRPRCLHRRLDMEDVIEGGPWLFQGQPIVLQPWEQGMSLRRQKHTQIPVWIRLRHLPMEYWTDEGLSTVASGVGTPLYTDGITKDCSRLDFARVCVMLDFNSTLPKHLVVISPVLRNGKEDPKRIDVEYEWLPQRCKSCCSLGHVSATCPANVKKNVAPPLTIFVKKQPPKLDPKQPEQGVKLMEGYRQAPNSGLESAGPEHLQSAASNSGYSGLNKGKDIVLHNSYSALTIPEAAGTENQITGPNGSSPMMEDP